MRNRMLVMTILLTLSLGLTGSCKKPPKTAPAPPPVETPQPTPTPSPEPIKEVPPEPFKPPPVESHEESVDEINGKGILKPVHFDYDKSDVRPEDRPILQANAAWLKSNPKWKVRIEGYCDERGTIKYNIALGERRANAVREYLVSLGVDASRIRIVSFGEDRPVNPNHNEEAWAANRRAEFYVEK